MTAAFNWNKIMKNVKLLTAAVLGVMLLVMAGLAWLESSIRGIVEERGGRALGVKTTIESVDLSLLSGQIDVRRLIVANPEGFQSPSFLDVGQVTTEVQIGSLWGEVVEIPSLAVRDVTVDVEGGRGRFNFRKILENLRKATQTDSQSENGGGRKLHVSTLEIRNIRARLKLMTGPAALRDAEIPIPDVTLKDLGSGGQTMPMDQLMSLIVESVMRGVANQGKGQLTRELLTDLWGQLSGQSAPGKKEQQIKDVVDDLQKLLRKP